MASYIGASAEQEDADPILMAFAAEATKGDPASGAPAPGPPDWRGRPWSPQRQRP